MHAPILVFIYNMHMDVYEHVCEINEKEKMFSYIFFNRVNGPFRIKTVTL